MSASKVSILYFSLLFTFAVYGKNVCELEYLVGPPTDPKAYIHTQMASPEDYAPELVQMLKRESRQARTSPLPDGHRRQLKDSVEKQLQDTSITDGTRLELETALALINDKNIGHTVRGYNVDILHPVPWEYLPSNGLQGDLKVFVDRGHHIRKFYELDVELQCCIIEVSFSNNFDGVVRKKTRQLSRMVNADGRTYFINPDGKKVILYTPNIPNDGRNLTDLGVTTTRTMGQLKNEIRRAMRSSR